MGYSDVESGAKVWGEAMFRLDVTDAARVQRAREALTGWEQHTCTLCLEVTGMCKSWTGAYGASPRVGEGSSEWEVVVTEHTHPLNHFRGTTSTGW